MGSALPPERIAALAPLLGSLARLLAEGTQVSDIALETLALSLGHDDPAAIAELQIWRRLLARVRDYPQTEVRLAAIEALRHRGLSEASVLLALGDLGSTSALRSPEVGGSVLGATVSAGTEPSVIPPASATAPQAQTPASAPKRRVAVRAKPRMTLDLRALAASDLNRTLQWGGLQNICPLHDGKILVIGNNGGAAICDAQAGRMSLRGRW